MALPDFFDRALQSASQALRDFDDDRFTQALLARPVTLAFDEAAITAAEGRATLNLAVRLLARLHPALELLPLGGAEHHVASLSALARSINPAIDIVEAPAAKRAAIVIGKTHVDSAVAIHAGSDRWIAAVGTAAPVGSADSLNPFGAGAAACLAVANLFRAMFGEWLTKADTDRDARFSLLNFETGERAANANLPDGIDLGHVQLAGVGAIGNGFLWTLANAPVLRGTLDVIDPEPIDLSNLQRYVLALRGNVGTDKVALATAALATSGLTVRPFKETWAEYAARGEILEHVAVALDTARDRVQLQGSLPRRITNAWTQAGDLGLSRHGFGADCACLACLYLPSGKRRNEDEIVAEELGLGNEQAQLMRVRLMLHQGTPVDEPFVREIAAAAGVDVERLLPFVGLPLRSFRAKAVCGNALLRAPDGGGADTQVPLAFQSALAGVMLAADVVAERGGLRERRPPTKSVLDVLRPLPERPSFAIGASRNGPARCICRDPDWVDAYRTKHADAA
ncbi:MAG: E2 ligase fold family C protein [Pseudomonadota bacterium]|nr:E2 ligase fold family C protein [Pseudomonadota bacterium]